MIPLFKVAMSPHANSRLIDTLTSGYIGEGPKVKEFEERLAADLGLPVLCTNSCTSALDMAYHLIGLGKGDEVISTPMTCLATNMPLALRGCKIRWADVDPRTGNISPESVADLISFDTKAIVVTDWAGRPCDYNALRHISRQFMKFPPIVEDAAHAFGARYNGEPIAESGGDYVAFSFQAIKHLTTGDGGALKVPFHKYEQARLLRWYGLDRNDSTAMRCLQQAIAPGFKYHMNDIAATIGLANLDYAAINLSRHRANASYYWTHLPKHIQAPFDPEASYWIYTILVDDPARFERQMAAAGITASQVHTRNDFQDCLPSSPHPLPGLDEFSAHMVSIPVGWWLSREDLEHIVASVTLAVGERNHAVV